MAALERTVSLRPEAVWAVLVNPANYPLWVLGMTDVRRVDADWPRPGTSFDYGFRWGPIKLSGRATVLAAHPPGHLRIRWRRGLIGESTAELSLQRVAGMTTIRLTESRTGLLDGFPENPLIVAIKAGNKVTSIDRLARLAHHHDIDAPARS